MLYCTVCWIVLMLESISCRTVLHVGHYCMLDDIPCWTVLHVGQ